MMRLFGATVGRVKNQSPGHVKSQNPHSKIAKDAILEWGTLGCLPHVGYDCELAGVKRVRYAGRKCSVRWRSCLDMKGVKITAFPLGGEERFLNSKQRTG